MPVAPSSVTVARSRYWVCACIRLVAGVVGAYYAVDFAASVVRVLIYTIAAPPGMSEFTYGFADFWRSHGNSLIVTSAACVIFGLAPAITRALLPTVGLHCHRCGYSRRGLVSTAPCPECGAHPEDAPPRT